ncbi:MsnO8 family LLM class oxidoreductase [Actinomadura rubrisoli]|uniref:MsnO8 family LLM class oxidoreductase n=1 Tax=Actinomadura rubrisoli TaxID=2530368 RepID=A0A4R5BAT8_9ACTN|nr:MsnO8 family LLM class oxidoreductase [Actinomadura rubrisoli]TDD83191.1 MsnO8 family LLM class oxidoreductase [Actinomadura rubrisoli]
MTPQLSVLDQSPVGEGFTHADALRSSVDLAQAAEEWGFVRYWVAEHHGSPGFASTAPEIMAAVLLTRTTRLTVGTGGVLLPLYPPAKVAEVFGVLASLYPGRVDLGLGRAGGPAEDYPDRVRVLRRMLRADEPGLAGAPAVPPRMWLLGGGLTSARLAGELRTGFAFAHFLNPGAAATALSIFRREPGGAGKPVEQGESGGDVDSRSVLAVRVVAAPTEAEAEALAQSVLLWRSRKDLGRDLPLPTPDTARNHRWTTLEAERAAVRGGSLIWGSPEQVHGRLVRIAAEHGVGEIMVNTLTCDPADRFRSYRLLAEQTAAPTPPLSEVPSEASSEAPPEAAASTYLPP